MAVILALDPGQRRTGIAVSDPTATLASPLQTHDRRTDPPLFDLLARICSERGVGEIVVGHPLTQGGGRSTSTDHAESLARKLADRFGLPVHLYDERYTSAEAERILAGRGASRGRSDAVAAAILLQAFLESRRDER
jgi:putative Holliday junction resolvase